MAPKHFMASGIATLFVAFVAGGVACSGETTTLQQNGDSGAPDTSVPADGGRDTAASGDVVVPPPDAPAETGPTDSGRETGPVTCGAAPCSGGNVCCVVGAPDGGFQEQCLAQCPDGGPPVQCDGPGQCSGGTPICCGHFKVGAGQPPNCPVESISSACAATCVTSFKTQCPAEDTVRLCQAKADCAGDAQNPSCCRFAQSGSQQPFCVSDAIAQFGGGTCLP